MPNKRINHAVMAKINELAWFRDALVNFDAESDNWWVVTTANGNKALLYITTFRKSSKRPPTRIPSRDCFVLNKLRTYQGDPFQKLTAGPYLAFVKIDDLPEEPGIEFIHVWSIRHRLQGYHEALRVTDLGEPIFRYPEI